MITLIQPRQSHGLYSIYPAEYNAWRGIKARCLNPKARYYENYGGRGVSVDADWVNDFRAFFQFVGPRPSPSHSIDRIDVNGNYEPGNVRWATRHTQNINQRPKLHSSPYRGVSIQKRDGKWRATISYDNTKIFIGDFIEDTEAAWMYDQYAIAFDGDDASTNFQYE